MSSAYQTLRPNMTPETGSRWLRSGVAFVWFATGVLVVHPYYREVGEATLAPLGLGPWIMWVTCAAEIFIALRVAFGRASTWLVLGQVGMVAGFTLILAVSQPMLMAHPMGVLTKNVPLVCALGTSWMLEREGWSKRALWLLRTGMAGIWVTEGLIPKILFQQELELEIARSVVPFIDASLFLILLGVAQIASGIAALLLRGRLLTWLLLAQVAALALLPILATLEDGTPWVHPFGPLTKNAPIIAGTLVLALRGVVPTVDNPTVAGDGSNEWFNIHKRYIR